MEAVTSGWPLWVLTSIILQDYYHKNTLDLTKMDTMLLFVKVISSGLLIVLNVDKFGIWHLSDYTKYKNVIILRCINNKSSGMRLISIHVNNQDNNAAEINCIECKENILDERYRESAYYHCDSVKCQYYLCSNCGWKYIREYQKNNKINDTELNDSLTKDMKLLYEDNLIINNISADNNDINDNENSDKEVLLINNDSANESTKSWVPTHNRKAFCKRFDGFLILLTSALMIQPFYQVWIYNDPKYHYQSDYFAVDKTEHYLVDSTLFIFIALMLRILIIIELIISFIISRLCDKSQALKIVIRWSVNFNYVFYLFGFFMIFPCWDVYWKFGIFVQISMILWCIMVGCALVYIYCLITGLGYFGIVCCCKDKST